MLNITKKKSVVLAALMACTGLTPASAQVISTNTPGEVSIPEMLPNIPVDIEGDNLGNHTATQDLNMNDRFITGLKMSETPDSSDAVNVGYLDGALEGSRDNLGNHIAERILNMRGYKITNVGNAYDGENGDAVNLYTLKRYLSEVSGADNLGNHIATRDLFLNGNTIHLGPITSTDPQTGLPVVPTGLVITESMVTNLDLPVNGSDAANKAYVDNLLGNVDMSNVVYTIGDQRIAGIKTFVQKIHAESGIDNNDMRIINVADPQSPTDAVNLQSVRSLIESYDQNFVISENYATQPIAVGPHSMAAGGGAQAGERSLAVGTGALATSTNSVVLGTDATSSQPLDIVIGNLARNAGDNGRNIILGNNARVMRGQYNIALGYNASATSPSTGGASIIAMGESTSAEGQHAVAIGPGSASTGTRTLALGSIARASASESIAIGRMSVANATSAVAIGTDAQSTATNSVAIGRSSTTNIADTVSVGNDTLKRRVLNVGDPVLDTDAVNLRSLRNEMTTYGRYSAGDGILFGTPVSGVTPINVNTSVVRTTGNQTIAGSKLFTSSVMVDSDANSGFGMRTAAGVIRSTIFSNADSLRFVRYASDGTTIGAQLAIMADGRILPANGQFDGAGRTITNVADPVDPMDVVNLRTLQAAIVPGGGDNLGNHIATTTLNMSNNSIINVAAPVNGGDVTNKSYVDNLFASSVYTAGSGVTISGTNVVAVDNTVVRTTGNQNIGGLKTFTYGDIVLASSTSNNIWMKTAEGTNRFLMYSHATNGNTYLRNYSSDGSAIASELVLTGTGFIYPTVGNLDGNNRVISRVANPVNATDVVNLRTLNAAYTGGSGIDVSSSQVISADSTVVRTTGNQSIANVKTFTGNVNMNGWDTLRLNAESVSLKVNPNALETESDTNLGFYAGKVGGNYRMSMYMDRLGTVTYDNRSYNSPILYLGIPYQSGITGNTVAGTGRDAGDDGNGTIMAVSYRDFRIFRRVIISGGLSVFSSRANDIARFDLPIVGYNGLTVSPGSGGEIRFHAPIYAHSYQTFSDERLKKNIETISGDEGMNIVRNLRPAFFDYKDDGRKASGVIAQEIQKVMPWAVLPAKDGMLTVDYTQIIAPLTSAVQDVDSRTQVLEDKLAAEIKRNDELENRIEKLEALMSERQ